MVRYLADRIAVLYRGELVEVGPAAAVFDAPRHPYTRSLLAAMPEAGASEEVPAWEPAPGWREAGPGHAVRCWRDVPAA